MVPQFISALDALCRERGRIPHAQLYPHPGDDDPGPYRRPLAAHGDTCTAESSALYDRRYCGHSDRSNAEPGRRLPARETHLDTNMDALQWGLVLSAAS